MRNGIPAESYLYFDGDDVGSAIELRLLERDLDGAKDVSERVTRAVSKLANTLRREFSAEVIFAAGDEVLALVPRELTEAELNGLRSEFRIISGVSVSCGVADSPRDATLNLHIAKLRGKNRTQVPTYG